jgi:membrane associated rhomboid family serine protease
MSTDPRATYTIIGICVVLWLGEFAGGNRIFNDLALVAGLKNSFTGQVSLGVADGEWWRIVTGGFLHDPHNPLHILFNMYVLYWLGGLLEPALGRARFIALYVASLLTGSLGAVLAVSAGTPTIGASGAVFGLMGAAFVMQRLRGVDPMQSGIGPVILLNLGLSFLIPGISIGGHIGGLVGGAACGFLLERLGRRGVAVQVAACAVIGIVGAVAAIAVCYSKAAAG